MVRALGPECAPPIFGRLQAEEHALYYTFNATEAPTGHEEFSLTRTKVLVNISGTRSAPVRNVRIQGLTLRDAAFTYLGSSEADRHWLPSEGDWALQRSGAVSIEGAEHVVLHANQLTRCDGNGVFLGGYTRGVSITGNHLASEYQIQRGGGVYFLCCNLKKERQHIHTFTHSLIRALFRQASRTRGTIRNTRRLVKCRPCTLHT